MLQGRLHHHEQYRNIISMMRIESRGVKSEGIDAHSIKKKKYKKFKAKSKIQRRIGVVAKAVVDEEV